MIDISKMNHIDLINLRNEINLKLNISEFLTIGIQDVQDFIDDMDQDDQIVASENEIKIAIQRVRRKYNPDDYYSTMEWIIDIIQENQKVSV